MQRGEVRGNKSREEQRRDFEDLAGVPKDMPLLDIPAIAMDVALALEYLHNAGFAHRDIKSSNVLLTWCPDLGRVRAKMCDFGSAAPISKMRGGPKRICSVSPGGGNPWEPCCGWPPRCSSPP